MLKSYEAIYENGQFKWLAEDPELKTARVIVTVLEETSSESEHLFKAEQAALALAQLGGSEPEIEDIPRRRWEDPDANSG